jgi:hypothetical protein
MSATQTNTTASDSKKRQRRRSAPDPQAIAFTIADAQAMGCFGRTKIYTLFKSGKLKYRKIGGSVLIDGDSLRALLRGDA